MNKKVSNISSWAIGILSLLSLAVLLFLTYHAALGFQIASESAIISQMLSSDRAPSDVLRDERVQTFGLSVSREARDAATLYAMLGQDSAVNALNWLKHESSQEMPLRQKIIARLSSLANSKALADTEDAYVRSLEKIKGLVKQSFEEALAPRLQPITAQSYSVFMAIAQKAGAPLPPLPAVTPSDESDPDFEDDMAASPSSEAAQPEVTPTPESQLSGVDSSE